MSLDTLACIHRDLDKIELAEKEFTECIKLCRELRDNSPQFCDGKLAHEYIELAKIKGDKVQHLDLLNKAKELLISHREQLDQLAAQLYEKEVLFREDLERIYGPRPWETPEKPEIEDASEAPELPENTYNPENTTLS